MVGLALFSCNSKDKTDSEEDGFSYQKFSGFFPKAENAYQVTDEDVLSNKDTTVIRSAEFSKLIPDSIKNSLFGKTAKVKYIAMGRVDASKNTDFYIVKAVAGSKKAALLLPFTNNEFDAAFPFLVPDKDASTTQTSRIDKTNNAIIKFVSKKKSGGAVVEGRDVYQYIPESKTFTLILTNPLNNSAEVINPIDTLPRKQKFSGDYVKNKRNFVSVRDGRNPKQLLVFMHIEDGDCSGEIKGDLFFTSTNKAVYRQAGDPCVISFDFGTNSVTVKEEGGCGSRRGLDCSFNGTFKRKKEAKAKTPKRKGSPK
jgi:hypothetical protein